MFFVRFQVTPFAHLRSPAGLATMALARAGAG